MKKYYIWDNENNKVIRDNIPTWELAWFIEGKLLERIDHCVSWSIYEYLV